MQLHMVEWYETIFLKLAQIGTNKTEESILREIAAELGYEYVAYGIREPVPLTRPKTTIVSTYPSVWTNHYIESNYVSIDPSVIHCLKSSNLFLWQDGHSKKSETFWGEAAEHQLRYGLAYPCHMGGGRLGVLSLARSAEMVSLPEVLEISENLRILSLLMTDTYGVNDSVHKQDISLSDREKEILAWTAEGKTSEETASILHISINTVNFHHKNIQRKMNTTNKLKSAVYAALLGLI